MSNMQSPESLALDPLRRPREIADLVRYLHEIGEHTTKQRLYKLIRTGVLPHAKAGRLTACAADYFLVRAPRAGKAG